MANITVSELYINSKQMPTPAAEGVTITREILAGKLDPAVPVCLDYEAGRFVLRQQIPAVTA